MLSFLCLRLLQGLLLPRLVPDSGPRFSLELWLTPSFMISLETERGLLISFYFSNFLFNVWKSLNSNRILLHNLF